LWFGTKAWSHSNALFRHKVQSNKAASDKHKRNEVSGSTVRARVRPSSKSMS